MFCTDVEITPNCVCIKNNKRRSDLRAWTFSFVTAFLCIICPLISLSADVTFFMICSGHNDKSLEILQNVQSTYGVPETPAPTKRTYRPQFEDYHKVHHSKSGSKHYLGKRETHPENTLYLPISANQATIQDTKSSLILPSNESNNSGTLLSTSVEKITATTTRRSLPAIDNYYAKDATLNIGRCQCKLLIFRYFSLIIQYVIYTNNLCFLSK